MLRFFRTQNPPQSSAKPADQVAAKPADQVAVAVAVAFHLQRLGSGPDTKTGAAVAIALRLHDARQRPMSDQPTAWSLSGRLQHMSARVGLQATPKGLK